jgi:hypothetical protein
MELNVAAGGAHTVHVAARERRPSDAYQISSIAGGAWTVRRDAVDLRIQTEALSGFMIAAA